MDADGVMRVGATRVTLDTLVEAFEDGATAEEISLQYPAVSLADVYAVIGYYLHRREDIGVYLAHRRENSDRVRLENEARCDPSGIRARLMARRLGPVG